MLSVDRCALDARFLAAMVFMDNKVALRQLELANAALLQGTGLRSYKEKSLAKDGKFHPRILTLGGDHTITLPLLRGVAGIYGPVRLVHERSSNISSMRRV